jgi:hypothetical protein
MALIEYLENDDWQAVLRRSFEGAITLLRTDRFRLTSSAIDDMRCWLAIGGISRVRLQLDRQMDERRLPDIRQSQIRDCLDQLIQEHHQSLAALVADDIIPSSDPFFT